MIMMVISSERTAVTGGFFIEDNQSFYVIDFYHCVNYNNLTDEI